MFPALLLTLLAADTGTITGTVNKPKGVTAVAAIDRSSEKDKRYPGKIDPNTGKFTIANLPLKKSYEVVIDIGNVRLEGVNLKVKESDFEEDPVLTKKDIDEIKKICKELNKFENEIDIMTVTGHGQYAVAILNKRRTTRFYESKPGEMIWRLEVWHFEKPDDDWIKDQDELGIIFYRERLQKTEFAKKSLTLDPQLGGLALNAKQKTIDLGKITLPDGKAGIHLRPLKAATKGKKP